MTELEKLYWEIEYDIARREEDLKTLMVAVELTSDRLKNFRRTFNKAKARGEIEKGSEDV